MNRRGAMVRWTAVLAVLLAGRLEAQSTAGRVIIRREADSVRIALPIHAGAAPVLSEPFHLRDRARLYLTLPNPMPEPLRIDAAAGTGLLSVHTQPGDATWQLIIEAPAFRRYRLATDVSTAALWVEPDTVAGRTSVVPPLPTQQALPRVEVAARPSVNAPVQALAGTAGPWVNVVLASARAMLPARVARPGLLAAIAVMVLVAGWLLIRRARRSAVEKAGAQTDRAQAPPPAASGEDPRIWAARTMAVDGLEVFEIARRTGLPRDVARLIVRGTRPNLPATAATAGKALAAGTPSAGRSRGATYWFTDN